MAKRWIGMALVAGCLSLAADAHGQHHTGACDPGGEMGPPCPGPMGSKMAPPGPDGELGIPADALNAFDHWCGSRPDYCCNGMWFSAEYLYLWMKDPRLSAPLVTTGATGVIGAADTVVALDLNDLDYPGNSGARFAAGFWLDTDRSWSVEMGGFVTEKRGTTYALDTDGVTQIWIPIFDNAAGAEAVDANGPFTGVHVNAAARMWGADVSMVFAGTNVALIGGWRYIDLAESLDIYSATAAGVVGRDHFGTRNQFIGGQLGVRVGGYLCSGLFYGLQVTAAAGTNHQASYTFGNQTTVATGVETPTNLFVQTTNTGKYTDHEFTFVPEGQLRVGYQATRNLSIFAGATYQYWIKALRPGDQINRQTLQAQTNTANGPILPFEQSDFWAFGASFGFELRY